MKKTQSLEIIGIGNFDVMPIKAEEQKFKEVNSEGKPLKKVLVEKGTPILYEWIDEETNKKYSKEDVYFDVIGNFVQEIKKSEKIKNFDLVDKMEIYNLSESSFAVLKCDKTTLLNFEEKVKDKAIKFNLKKSSRGFKWVKAFILKFENQLVLVSGLGDIKKAIVEFAKNSQAQKEVNVIVQKVEMRADEIEVII